MIQSTAKSAALLLVLAALPAALAQDPAKIAGVLRGDNKTTPENNRQCKLYTKAEAAKYIGKPVGAIGNAAGGSGCQWTSTDEESDLIVVVIPASYHTAPSLAPGFKRLPETVGTKAFVAPELGGFAAGAIRGAEAIRVSVAGPAASEATAVALLNETIKRLGK